VTLIRLLPHQSMIVGDPSRSVLVVALDDALSTLSGEDSKSSLRPGICVARQGDASCALSNTSEKEARLISFTFER